MLVNAQPVVSEISDAAMNENDTLALDITVGDVESSALDLVVSALSDNVTLVPKPRIQLAGCRLSRRAGAGSAR